MAKPEPAAGWYMTKKHYSTNLAPSDWHPMGRRGTAICNGSTDVNDQEWFTEQAKQYPHLGKRKVAELPECKLCAKKIRSGVPA